MAWYDQLPEDIQLGNEAGGSTLNYAATAPAASDFSNLNLGNMDFSNWGMQNFVPDYQPAPTTSYQMQPTPQPTTAVPYTDYSSPLAAVSSYQMQPATGTNPDVAAVRAGLGDELTITPRQLAAAPIANNGEVSPFTTNPYMVVNYGKDTNTPTFENTQNLDPTQAYRLVNQNTGQTLVSDPSDPTSLARLVLQANQLSGNQPTDASWELYSGATGGDKIASDYPNQLGGVLGALVQYGLPIGLSLIPGLNWLGSAAMAGLGSTAGKLISNYDLGDALKSGLITAGTAGLLKAPILQGGQSVSGALSNAIGLGGTAPNIGDIQMNNIDALTALGVNPELAGQVASGSIGSLGGAGGGAIGGAVGGSNVLNDAIQVIGNKITSNIPSSYLSGALGAASGALSGTNYGDRVWDRPPAQEADVEEPGDSNFDPNDGIEVVADKYKVNFDPTSILNKYLNADYGVEPNYDGLKELADQYNNMYEIEEPYADEDIVVEGAKKTPTVIPPPASLPDLFPPLNSVDIPTDLAKEWPEVPTEEPEIVVEGYPPRAPDLLPVFFPPINSVDIPPADTFQPSKDKSVLDEIKKYTDLAKLAATGLGGLFGSGGSGAGGYAGMRGPLNAVFSAQLPPPNMQPSTPRSMAGTDWYRYGYGPEQSFFGNVPQGGANTSSAYTGYEDAAYQRLIDLLGYDPRQPRRYAEGGYAVGGPGDGRDDKIPAMLSDGEYVMDAETVALLGNGSPKAGADLLDKFRVNVRKHKGRDLAKGKFSANAKKPEQYLKGRK